MVKTKEGKNMNFKGKMQRKSGITLISLVVTIVILLILAGITIAALTGNNGLFIKVQEAKKETEQAEKEEKEKLGDMEDTINEYTTGTEVQQVTDKNPGILEGTGTEADPYTINSIEDLIFFAYNVTNGNTYDGQTVKLGLSLDFNSTKSYVDAYRTNYETYGYDGELKTLLTTGEGFKQIGTSILKDDSSVIEGNFARIFDGNNNVIYNCYMYKDMRESEKKCRLGLFGAYLFGEVKNLGLVNINSVLLNQDLEGTNSGIAGSLKANGKISNCYISGDIKQYSTGKGNVNCSGFIVYNSGTIENSFNLANIYGEIKLKRTAGGCYLRRACCK